MKIKYIGLSDSREIASTDFPDMDHYPETWVVSFSPDQELEVPDEVGEFLVNSMKNEFRSMEVQNTDADQDNSTEEAEPPGDSFWDLPQPENEPRDTDEAIDREVGVQPGWLDADQLDTGTSKTVLQRQMAFRELDSDGMTRRAMLDAITDHDASREAPEDA